MVKFCNKLSAAGAGAIVAIGFAWTPGVSTGAPGSKSQDDIILARQGLMEVISDLLNDGEAPETDTQAMTMQAAAETVALTLPPLKFLFPAESNPKNPKFKSTYRSYALPAVWQNPEKFSQYLDAAIEAARALEQATDAKQYPALARSLVASCDACHAQFRAPFESPFDKPEFQGGVAR